MTSILRHDVNKFLHSVKITSWRHRVRHDVNEFVITTKSSSWRQKYGMTSKGSSWCQKYVMKSKSSSWRQKCCLNVKNTPWRKNVTKKCHCKVIILLSKIRHDANKVTKKCHCKVIEDGHTDRQTNSLNTIISQLFTAQVIIWQL